MVRTLATTPWYMSLPHSYTVYEHVSSQEHARLPLLVYYHKHFSKIPFFKIPYVGLFHCKPLYQPPKVV